MKRDAVVYLNTKKKGDFELQKSEVENYAKYRFNLIRIYHDHRMNAVHPEKRDSYCQMIDFCNTGNIRNIILYDLLELSKDPDHGISVLKTLTDSEYIVYCASGDIFGFGDTPEARQAAIRNFISYMNEYRTSMQKAAPAVARKTTKRESEKSIGRPKALNEGQIEALLTVRRTGTSISQICRMFNVSRSTVSKILAKYPELKGEWKGSRPEAEQVSQQL
jgi:DNA invertase Pin-like site-specific DNA recombinase